MHRLVVSAPFGNYIQPDGATPTLGTFTALRRPGRLGRVLRTVRWYPRIGAWVNRIGLRNPGIEWLCARVDAGRVDVGDKVVSIHGFDEREWDVLLERSASLCAMGIELNMSCPNVGEIDWPLWLFGRAVEMMGGGSRVIVKLPPVHYESMLEQALDAGVWGLHCCNTIPVESGGISGKPLKPFSLACIRDVVRRAGERGPGPEIIGGGGITSVSDIDAYAQAGATRVAIGTYAMNPVCLVSDRRFRPLIEHAERVLDGA